jgi:molecular chaperone GrpE
MLRAPQEDSLSENNGTAPDAVAPKAAAEGKPAEPEIEIETETASERAEGPSADAAAVSREVEKLKAELEESQRRARETQQRLVDEHDRWLRTAADLENYKRRSQKEKEDTRKFGVESALKDFLPVADNLERALDHAESADKNTLLEGVRLVQKLFETTLARHGVTSFSALGKTFDPTHHEALMQAEHDGPPNTVIQEMARGYKLHDRLVRPAAVVVSRAKAPPAEQPTAAPPVTDGEKN